MPRGGARALGASALFAALLAAPALAADCPAGRYHETVRVEQVFDGDTVRLRDGRKLRFVGIDTPELGRDEAPPEPLAEAARAALTELLGENARLHLRFDAERHDRYGRLLAHPFLDDGTNLSAALLARGLGTALVVPPNTWQAQCYAAVEARARQGGRGVWRLPAYRPVPVEAVPLTARGFRIVTGRVQRVGESRSSYWLDLGDRLTVRIKREDLAHFAGLFPPDLNGRKLVARGHLHYHKGKLYLRVRHPAALQPLD